ncbi:hypothetical protein CYMTET_25158 [Cymbomonas tetramitiformis]|uniref:Uncharacterized protein n=1 Tax=Cymbomonas tetramitiformis TaxID=36881 RepID=A0AAE0FV52_9CHLO|nr:hypothetical protein CYMTET_25158 [Cymbomonas tetramitiformis]
MHIGFKKVWEPRYHTLDHSLAFFNANAKLPQTITHVLEYLGLPLEFLTLQANDIVQDICWSHCKMKLNETPALFNDQDNVCGFKTEGVDIHRITISSARDKAFKLFIELYERDEEYTCHLFADTWWASGVGGFLAFNARWNQSIQNSPERTNMHVKDETTLRQQLQLEVFHPSARENICTRKQSTTRNTLYLPLQ